MKSIIKQASRALFWTHLVCLALLFAVFAALVPWTKVDLNSGMGTVLLLICGGAVLALQITAGYGHVRIPDFVAPDPMFVDSEPVGDEYCAPDPWEMQRRLMAASDQATPAVTTLSNNSVLYGALIMEEAGETFCALADALHAYHSITEQTAGKQVEIADALELSGQLRYLANRFAAIGELNQESSCTLRDLLKKCAAFQWEIPEKLAVEMFDGTTDVAVVNAGFALASGFPGQRGYNEVARSNLSKANSGTGKIDKTADGKWIKGSRYFEPNLAAVLQQAREEAWVERADDHQWGTAQPAPVTPQLEDLPALTAEEEEEWRDLERAALGPNAMASAPTRGA